MHTNIVFVLLKIFPIKILHVIMFVKYNYKYYFFFFTFFYRSPVFNDKIRILKLRCFFSIKTCSIEGIGCECFLSLFCTRE